MGGMGELRLSQPRPNKRGDNKMDFKTKLAVVRALRYKLLNEDCKVNLPTKMYAEALDF